MVTRYSVEAVKKNVGNSMIIMSGNQTFEIGFGGRRILSSFGTLGCQEKFR